MKAISNPGTTDAFVLNLNQNDWPENDQEHYTEIPDSRQLPEGTGMEDLRRLAGVGILTGSVAHDINNALCGISMLAQTLEKNDGSNQSETSLKARMIVDTTAKASRLLRRVLNLTKPSSEQKRQINIHEILEDVVELVLCGYRHRIGIKLELKAEQPIIVADPAEFQSAVLNLLVNARDAIEDRGEISIRTRNENEDEGGNQGRTGRRRVVVEIGDTGCGIPIEHIKEVFTPFTTSKENGTGLGLPTVRRFLTECNATLRVKSMVNKGTTFQLNFAEPSMLPIG